MNKTELIDAVAAKTGLTKTDANKAIEALVATVTETVKAGDKVTLVGFGTFKASPRAARVAKNPKTGEPIDVAASIAPTFKAGAAFKAALNE